MHLYFDAVAILTAPSSTGGSFKSRLYNSRSLRAAPAQIYALIVEAAKWDILLKEVIDQSGILKQEPKLYPLLALLLVHDHLLAKNGIAAPASHPLRQAIERHKIRLKGEFTKARVRRGCATISDLKEAVRREKLALQQGSVDGSGQMTTAVYPRWVRVNNVRTTLETQLKSTFASYRRVETLGELVGNEEPKMRLDPHIPDLVAVPPGMEFTTSPTYKNGEIILQDKASCFPAYLLLGDQPWKMEDGDLLDGCAAPGNKTTHLASLLAKMSLGRAKGKSGRASTHIFSMDASPVRAKTLQKMVTTAGADDIVTVLQGQDFLALDPADPRFERVAGLLLDPSCSGSGIIGRDDVPKLALPTPVPGRSATQGKKRKRNDSDEQRETDSTGNPASQNGHNLNKKKTKNNDALTSSSSPTDENELTSSTQLDPERLTKLSNLQTRIVEHALSFPAATRITYSTCSIHMIENESVVERILASEVARRRGWRVMRREEQPKGLRAWQHRGVRTEKGADGVEHKVNLSDEELEGCLRCWPGDDEGTGGFFVAGFVRDGNLDDLSDKGNLNPKNTKDDGEIDGKEDEENNDDDDDEWDGFSD